MIPDLDARAVIEHGLRFRWIPAGPFLMGSADGDPDEQPVHQVDLDEFWLTETAISWSDYGRLMGWSPPPTCFPHEDERPSLARQALFFLSEVNKIRLQYCEDETLRARDWHAHVPASDGGAHGEIFGTPRRGGDGEYRYREKPMVAVSWQEAEELCNRLSTPGVVYRLPTEEEWEKAARGGLAGKRYPWGDAAPTPELCDLDRLEEFSIKPFRSLPPNGYGLYGMCGSVWEWTSTEYTPSYSSEPPTTAGRPAQAEVSRRRQRLLGSMPDLPERVLRGGSWADAADAVTVSFRMSHVSLSWRAAAWSPSLSPNIGFRVCRVLV